MTEARPPSTGKKVAGQTVTLAAPCNPWDRAPERAIYGSLMAEKKTAGKPGRKPPDGEKKQFLTFMDPAGQDGGRAARCDGVRRAGRSR